MVQNPNDQMPFLDHLEELRQRLFWIFGSLFVATVIAFVIVDRYNLIHFLQRPILGQLGGNNLAVFKPLEGFTIYIQVSFIFGAMMALPVIGYQIWAFLAPGLYAHEKKLMIPVVLGATILFAAGVALSFFVILPITLTFLIGFASKSFTPLMSAGGYFGFLIGMSLALGLVFELPIVIVALTALGLVTPEMLVKFRRYSFVSCLVVAAFVTPGSDPISMGILAVPLYGLYELSVVLSRVVVRMKKVGSASDTEAMR